MTLKCNANPYDNIASRPQKKNVVITRRIDYKNSPISSILCELEKEYPDHHDLMKQYTIWAAGLIKRFIDESCLWDAIEIMESWAQDKDSVSKADLKRANELASSVSKNRCSGHLWISDKSAVAAKVIEQLTRFDVPPNSAMCYIEQAHKLDVEYSHELITARDVIASCRKVAQVDVDPMRSQYQMLQGFQLVEPRRRLDNAIRDYENRFNEAIDAARNPQFDALKTMVLYKINIYP